MAGLFELGSDFAPLHPACRRQGYAREAVRALSDWALAQTGIAAVRASVEFNNHGSKAVLRDCGFGYVRPSALDELWERRR
jgi:RimJ/RimL family protein N-acetyltransferase